MPILAYSQHWDAGANFSYSSNPNGAWSYGYKPSATGTTYDLDLNVSNPYGWNAGGQTSSPAISAPNQFYWNDSANNGISNILSLHPFQGSGPAVCLRWTAPYAGNYSISAVFYGTTYGGFNIGQTVYILTNGIVAYQNEILSYGQIFSNTDAVSLSSGGTIDVVIANNPGVANDWSGASVIINEDPSDATATANVANGFVVGATLTDEGYGYTNTPLVRFIGGGGSGAQAVAMVSSNGQVTNVSISNPGSGYTNTPLVFIDPLFLNPILSIAPMTFFSFSNLTLGSNYQLQQWEGYYWSNQPVSFTATNAVDTQIVAGVATNGDYQLALSPVPAQAFATPQITNGFIVAITVTSGGSGYVTAPLVTIVGSGSGSNATAVAQISTSGVVTNIAVGNPGIGYTSGATVEIAQPPNASVSPSVVLPMMALYSANLNPYENYQIQFVPKLGGTWGNWNGGLFSPTAVTNLQNLFITNGVGFFRLQYLP
jgi:hypothetical protein